MSGRMIVGELRKRERPVQDTRLLFERDASVDLLVDDSGVPTRWRGIVERPASGERRSIVLAPFGVAGPTLEILLSQIREVAAYDHRCTSPIGAAIEALQKARLR